MGEGKGWDLVCLLFGVGACAVAPPAVFPVSTPLLHAHAHDPLNPPPASLARVTNRPHHHHSCGSNTVSETCAAYGIFSGQCNHAAVAGGGKECGNTFVCCVITKPTPIPVGTDGFCGT